MAAFDPDDSFIDLYWIPVGAGTHLQALSLSLYEILAASVARRPRATLYHGALKLQLRGKSQTLELMPVPRHQANPPLMTGPVGVRGADRLRRFRYQLYCADSDLFPDEKWAVGSPKRLTTNPATVESLLANALRPQPYLGTEGPWHHGDVDFRFCDLVAPGTKRYRSIADRVAERWPRAGLEGRRDSGCRLAVRCHMKRAWATNSVPACRRIPQSRGGASRSASACSVRWVVAASPAWLSTAVNEAIATSI